MPVLKCIKCNKIIHISGVEEEEIERLRESFICPDCNEKVNDIYQYDKEVRK
jgi:DNA-directed RNA polymerase subunit RPC12/RpoP